MYTDFRSEKKVSDMLNQTMGVTNAKAKAEAEAKKESPETFFDRNRQKLMSGEAHSEYQLAKGQAMSKALAFQKTLHDSSSVMHSLNLANYKSKFGSDLAKVEQFYLDESGVPDPNDYQRDPGYEQHLHASYVPTVNPSKDSIAFFSILNQELAESRNVRGYGPNKKYDKEVIENWKNKYSKK